MKVVKTVSSVLRPLCPSLAWDTCCVMLLLKQVRRLRSLQVVLAMLRILTLARLISSNAASFYPSKAFFGGLATLGP